MLLLRNILLLYFIFSATTACRKNGFITSPQARLTITADTIRFDTVFTTVGSVTKTFKIVNDNDQKINIGYIRLMGGNTSPYRINVDGYAQNEVSNIEIAAEDSIYVFVSVTIDPASQTLPFLAQDSILVVYNGNDRLVQLEAFGQNAHFLRNTLIGSNTVWTNDLPYVILGGLLVDTNTTLTIEKGCRIYLHADAPLLVDGTLQVLGTKDEKISFRGDRLDPGYDDLPASWPGIYLRPGSSNNVILNANLYHSYQALVVQGPSTGAMPQLKIEHSIIDNSYDAGLFAINTFIQAANCLFSNCSSNIVLARGGNYTFTHCTAAAYSNNYISHKNPVLYMDNWDSVNNQLMSYSLSAAFVNCIFWGDFGTVENEVVSSRRGMANFDVRLEHCIFKAKTDPADVLLSNSISNQDPAFDSINTGRRYFDFHINNKTSPAIDAGRVTLFTTDLDGRSRTGVPDIGCYEK